MQKINMNKYGILRWRFTVTYDNGDYSDFRYTKYDGEGKVTKRQEGKHVSTLFAPGNKDNKFIVFAIMYDLVNYLKENELYGDQYRDCSVDESIPETIRTTHYKTKAFTDISRAEIYFKKHGNIDMLRSSYSCIFPAEITDELRDMKFAYGDLWAIVYISYINGTPSKTDLYMYSVDKDKLEDLARDINNVDEYSI